LSEGSAATPVQLSFDGSEGEYYANRINWSPDSKKLAVFKIRANKQHPIYLIEYIYAGPQDAFVPKSFVTDSRGSLHELAELGFIVVQCDGMGTSNRSKAFHDICWKNLKDGGFPDRIAWIKAVAKKYPYMDISRMGIFGNSAGGQNAMGALLFHPEFG
jgi:dipeptidyl aminopeptidase/acylaminoacyl peptidase